MFQNLVEIFQNHVPLLVNTSRVVGLAFFDNSSDYPSWVQVVVYIVVLVYNADLFQLYLNTGDYSILFLVLVFVVALHQSVVFVD
ncbi:hypothetical protein Avbf_12256 [Armadillidium vulgare]|nr:hypothetical protein Avbf_12256 [Armadillidium vulgare]